jgi:Flp pilus assembly protein TadG
VTPTEPGISARRPADAGASPVELAILLPVIVFAIFISVQIAFYFLAREEAMAAAEEAASQVRGYGHQTAADKTAAQARAVNFLGNGKSWLVKPTVPPPVISGNDIDVTVTGFSVSLFPGWNIAISEHAHATVEHTTTVP